MAGSSDSTVTRIARALETAIVEGEFAHGARLDETALSTRFGVSRTPLREALGRLALTGLVEQRPRRGTFVREVGAAELLDLFEVMAELEAACGRFAALRADADAVARIRAADDACGAALSGGDADRYYAENATFHRAIYAASGNAFLSGEAGRLHRRLTPYRRLQLRARGRLDESRAEHAAILAAIEGGDPDAAASGLRAHVSVQGGKFRDLVVRLSAAA